MTRNFSAVMMLTVLVTSISNAMDSEVSEVLGRKMQSRAKQVFEFCDKDHNHILSVVEQNDADTKAQKVLDGMSKEREIGGKRVPPSVDEPIFADPERVTLDEFVQHFQAMGSIADAKARAVHASKIKVIAVQVPVAVPVASPAPARMAPVWFNPYPVFLPEHHHHRVYDGMAPQQSVPVFSQPVAVEHHHVQEDHHHEQHAAQSRHQHAK